MSSMPTLSSKQWNLLAILHALEEPVSFDLLGYLSGLSISQLMDSLKLADDLNLIDIETNRAAIRKNITDSIQKKLEAINIKKWLTTLLDRIYDLKMENAISPSILSNLLINAARDKQAAQLKIRIASRAIDEGHIEDSYKLLAEGLSLLTPFLGQDKNVNDTLFISTALLFSNMCFYLGKGFDDAYKFAEKALEVSKYLGDKRSQTLIELHIGKLLYMGNRKLDSIKYLASGQKAVELLGDDDIRTQSYEFIGLYYFIKGLHKEAMEYFDKAVRACENHTGTQFMPPTAPVFFSLSVAYLGQFPRAIGMLDYFWRLALSNRNVGPACLYRSILGTVLLMMGKKQEAFWHLEGALRDAINNNNALTRYLSYAALAYYNFLNKNYKEAHAIYEHMFNEGQSAGIRHQFASPHVIEMLYEFEMTGFEPIPGYNFGEQAENIMREPSVHLLGVVLRLKARKALLLGENIQIIESYLNDSINDLQLSGDTIQLSKAKVELAILRLRQGNSKEAQKLTQEARKGLSGISEELFPDGMRFLLQNKNPESATLATYQESLLSQLDMIIKSPISPVFEETLDSMVSQMTRLFGAERSGLFGLNNTNSKDIILLASRNLHKNEITSINFNSGIKFILKTFQTAKPQKRISEYPNFNLTGRIACHMLCLPLKIDGKVRAVLYFDNSYILDCFDNLSDQLLFLISYKLSVLVEQVENISRLMEQKFRIIKEESVQRELSGKYEFIKGESHLMVKILEAVDKVACTDSPVLIDGETGSGKELIARRIHDMSYRSKKPLVILDMTTIPENLTESELFGYEKGAFTGANTRKIGRIEQTHEGTLYIDEIGEVPKSLQVKLLRVLQEKTFTRIGGTRQLESDFRLIAATNRNLKEEVAAGRFREDLYYRLSVVNITLPPLRERPEDIIPLANFFLSKFTKRYNRPSLKLSRSNEEKLLKYSWPGNVRELNNVIERAAILSEGDHLELTIPSSSDSFTMQWFDSDITLDEMQRRYIRHVLERTGGRIAGAGGAAEILGMKRTSLNRRMQNLGIKRVK